MRTLFLLMTIHLLNFPTMGQIDKEFNSNFITIKLNDSIDGELLTISIIEAQGWHTIVNIIFESGELNSDFSPPESGLYNLVIQYSDSLFYNEILLYRTDPISEKLSFDFYEHANRIFCKINSVNAIELNKEIVLNHLSDELKGLIEKVRE